MNPSLCAFEFLRVEAERRAQAIGPCYHLECGDTAAKRYEWKTKPRPAAEPSFFVISATYRLNTGILNTDHNVLLRFSTSYFEPRTGEVKRQGLGSRIPLLRARCLMR